MKKFTLLTLSLIALFVLTGCSNKQGSTSINLPTEKNSLVVERCKKIPNLNKEYCTNKNLHINRFLSSTNLSAYGVRYALFNNSNSGFMQAMAETTLFRKKNYFAIIEPNYLSNLNGSLINTPEEFFKRCDINVGSFFVNSDPCDIHRDRYGKITDGAIALFDEQPSDVLVYDARAVLKYLKDNGRFDPELKNNNYTLSKLTENQFQKLSNRFNYKK